MSSLLLAGCKKEDAIEMLNAPPPPSLQKYWPLPDFSLTERSGRAISLADLKGKVWIADFIYTTCPGPCPMLSTRMSDLQKTLGKEANVRFVSVSTNPENDTPQVLSDYAGRFKAGDHWWFLTGTKDAVYKLAREGFKLPIAEPTPGGAGIVHSTRLILVDKQGVVRGLYDGLAEAGTQNMTPDIRRLLEEK